MVRPQSERRGPKGRDIQRILYSDDCLNDELALPTVSVDLIYLDPPFNSKSIYNLPFAGKDRFEE